MRRASVWAVAAVVALALALSPLAGAGAGPEPRVAPAPMAPTAEPEAAGRQLFVTGCSSCHGLDGRGTDRGPTLERAGAASAHYYLSTGRMPLADDSQPSRKDPAYSPEEIDLLVDYVASIGEGPPIPEVDPAKGDLAEGGVLFRAECAACHAAAGIGGALSYGGYAPSLHDADPRQIASAVRVGPGNMPDFGPEVFDEHEVDSLVRYVRFLRHAPNPGGARLGGAGPIPEGFVGWLFGIGALVAVTLWIGTGRRGKGRV
jgi:ubiquinol-cytochrome c reductase cytochrome c subunit